MKHFLLATTLLVWAGVASAQSIESATLKPDGGSITDAQGHVWLITASGSIMEDGQYTPGGGGTATLAIVNGIVYGKDDGHGPVNAGGWFTLSGNGQSWQVASAPTSANATPSTNAPSNNTPNKLTAPVAPYVGVCTTAAPNVAASAGGFGVLNGQIYTPDGTPFIARGINVRSNELGDVLSGAVTGKFPGINFVRVNIRATDSPASLASAVNYLTAQGIVVELEDHPDAGGGQDSWSDEPNDVAWYGQAAAYFKNNPYVWFGTFNEPAATNLSAWQKATYDAIRGAGNNNPIMLQIMGWPGAWNNALDPSVYKSMTNTIWDTHFYGWTVRDTANPNGYSTNQTSVDQALTSEIKQVQQIQSADGVMPALIGEYGDSTDGANVDANGSQVIKAVLQSGLGSAAWSWISAGADALRNSDGSLSPFGQSVAAFVKDSGNQGCAQSPVVSSVSPQTAPSDLAGSSPVTAPNLGTAAVAQTAPPLAANPLSVSAVATLAAGQ